MQYLGQINRALLYWFVLCGSLTKIIVKKERWMYFWEEVSVEWIGSKKGDIRALLGSFMKY